MKYILTCGIKDSHTRYLHSEIKIMGKSRVIGKLYIVIYTVEMDHFLSQYTCFKMFLHFLFFTLDHISYLKII